MIFILSIVQRHAPSLLYVFLGIKSSVILSTLFKIENPTTLAGLYHTITWQGNRCVIWHS